MRILNIIPTLGVGGAERWQVTVGKALERRGHEIHVAALWEPYTLANELEDCGIRVFRLNVPHRRMFPIALYKLCALLRRTQYDAVHGHLLFGSLYSRLSAALVGRKVPVVSTFYNLGYDSYPPNTILRKFGKMVDGWTARQLEDAAICVSRLVEAHFKQHLGVAVTHVYPLGVEPLPCDQHLPGQSSQATHGGGSKFVIIHPARLVSEKGHRYLLQSLEILRDRYEFAPSVLLVGDGPLRETIQEKVRECRLSVQVQFIGQVSHSRMMSLLASSDLLVLPSTHDGCPTVVIEAMQVGVPVVATRVGGLVDLIEHGVSGLLVPSADPEALAESIWSVVNSSALQEEFTRNARARVEDKFLSDKIATQYELLYHDLIREKAKPS